MPDHQPNGISAGEIPIFPLQFEAQPMAQKPWHNNSRSHFFKFTTAAVAEKIIREQKLRWSSPEHFNDPFDHKVSLIFPFTKEEAAREMFKAQTRLIFGPHEPAIVKQTELGELSLGIRGGNFSPDERSQILFEIEQGAREVSEKLDDFQRALNSAFQDHLSHSRILCLSETNENVVMWSHYAEQHKGVVFKLRCPEGVDDNLFMARKVEYVENFPWFVSAKKLAEDCLGLDTIDAARLADSCCYLKHRDWSYEKEWRVILPLLPGEPRGDGIQYGKKTKDVFEAIYLGCRMPKDDEAKLLRAAKSELPDMEVYRARQSNTSFQLIFDRIPALE